MPLTRVIDRRKERENINKFCDLKGYTTESGLLWKSGTFSRMVFALCFVLPLNEKASWDKDTWEERKVLPSHLWPEVWIKENWYEMEKSKGYVVISKIYDPNHLKMTGACHIIFERWFYSTQMNGISFAASFQFHLDHKNVHWLMKCLLTPPPCITAVPAFHHSWVLWPKLLGQRHYMCTLIFENCFPQTVFSLWFPHKNWDK